MIDLSINNKTHQEVVDLITNKYSKEIRFLKLLYETIDAYNKFPMGLRTDLTKDSMKARKYALTKIYSGISRFCGIPRPERFILVGHKRKKTPEVQELEEFILFRIDSVDTILELHDLLSND